MCKPDCFSSLFGNLPEKRNFFTNTSPLLNEPGENPIKKVGKEKIVCRKPCLLFCEKDPFNDANIAILRVECSCVSFKNEIYLEGLP